MMNSNGHFKLNRIENQCKTKKDAKMAQLGQAIMKIETFKIQLNSKVKDKITGFEGWVTGRSDYITGCNVYLVQPECKEGAWVEARWFDQERLEVLIEGNGPMEWQKEGSKPGSDMAAPVK